MSFEQWKSAPINTLFLLDGSPDGVLAWEDESALLAFQKKPRVTTVSIAARKLDALAELLEAAMREPPFPAPWDLRIGQPDIKAVRRVAEPLGWAAAQHYVALLRPELARLPAARPIVRRATQEDLEPLIALNGTTREGEFRTLSIPDEVRTWLTEDQVFVTEDPEGLTGFVVTWCYPRDVRDHQFIAALAVAERAGESDLGRALLVNALHWGRETGARKALTWVEKSAVELRRLYESLGFEAYGDEELHLVWNGRVRTPAPAERDPRPGDRRTGTVPDLDAAITVVERRTRGRPEARPEGRGERSQERRGERRERPDRERRPREDEQRRPGFKPRPQQPKDQAKPDKSGSPTGKKPRRGKRDR